MSVQAIYENYSGPIRDKVENYHGNQLVYVGWDEHMMFPFAATFPLPPQMPFDALLKEVLPPAYGVHPDFAKIEWATAQWRLDGAPFVPDLEKSLAENGIGHKSLLRLATPGLTGIAGTGF
jgi:phenol/toluene 2-monooxygenase (NADH) P4/A4